MRFMALVVATIATCSSPPPQRTCAPQETRCNGAAAEICTPERAWAPLLQCSAIEDGTWGCEVIDGSATCMEATDAAP